MIKQFFAYGLKVPEWLINMKDTTRNGFNDIIPQTIAKMKDEQGNILSLKRISLEVLGRQTGVSRAKLSWLNANNFYLVTHGVTGAKASRIVLTAILVA